MQTSTALGLLVGGAVLLLAVTPPRPAPLDAQGNQIPAAPAPGGALNPFNWFGGGASSLSSRIFGQNPAAPAPGYQYAGYQSPPHTPVGAFSKYPDQAPQSGYSAAGAADGYQGAGIGTPAAFQFPVMTPGGGFQSLQYMSPYTAPAANDGGGGYQPAAYTYDGSPFYTGAVA